MWKSLALVLGLSLVGCVDGEEAPVATVTAPTPAPARALAARQMPTLPSLPELPEPATSDPWAPNYQRGEAGAEALYVNNEVDPAEEEAIAKQYAESEPPVDEHDYEGEGTEPEYDCPEGCGEEPGYDEGDAEAEPPPPPDDEIEDCH